MSHPSSSHAQREAEAQIRDRLGEMLGYKLRPESLRLSGGARVDIDGTDGSNAVFVEIYARQGKLSGAQPKKVATDALKLLTLGRQFPEARLIVAFASKEAASYVEGKGWMAESFRTWKVEIVVVEISESTRAALLTAQATQVMTNGVEVADFDA